MKLPIALGIKPALITAAVLLAVIGGMGIKLKLANSERDTAVAGRSAAITERDAWKSKAADALAANKAYDTAFAQFEEAAQEDMRQAQIMRQKAMQAVIDAQANEAAANRELDGFKRRFAAKPADCTAALARLDAVCKIGSY